MPRISKWNICLGIAAIAAFGALQLFGQATQGTIFGTVTDQSGAAVPGARVTVTSVERGVTRTTATSTAGEYTVPDLELGSYTVRVEATGFKKAVIPPVVLTVKARIRVDAKLEVGSMTQTVEVTGASTLVRTGSAEVSNVLGHTELENLPISSRNLLQVASLTPGTNPGNPGGRQAQISGYEITVNGALAESNNFIIDGVSDNMEFEGAMAAVPPIDAVQEFAVQTSQYSAEFGHSGGGVINMALKSGTNQIHGFAYDYFKNNDLNATNTDFTGTFPKAPALHQNRFGGGAGGPLKKNKYFWFLDYEGLRSPGSTVSQTATPTQAEKQGNFSQAGFNIYDPTTAQPNPNNPSQLTRTQFPNNVIPTTSLDATGAGPGLLSLFPDPNYTPAAGITTNYLTTLQNTDSENTFAVKGDADLTSKDVVSAHVLQRRLVLASQGWLPAGELSSSLSEIGTNAGLTYTRNLSPTLLNEARVSYNRFLLPGILDYTTNVMDKFNVPGWHTERPYGMGFPSISIANISSAAPVREMSWVPTPFSLAENVYQYLDTVSWIKGAHAVKFGAEIDHVREDRYQARSGGGTMTFSGSYTTQNVGDPVIYPRSGVADMLLGDASSLDTQYGFDAIRDKDYRIGSFIQDDWRLTRKLVANLGLRWDFYSPFHEEQDRVANVDLTTGTRLVPSDARSVVQNTLGLPGGNLPPGWAYVSPSLVNPEAQYRDFSPRVGFAYEIGQNVSVRAGYGLFYGETSINTFNNAGTEGNPFFFDYGINGSATAPATFAAGFASGGIYNVLAATNPGSGGHYAPIDRPDPYGEKWNAHVEWGPAGKSLIIDAGYDGERGLHFPTLVPLNEAQPSPLPLSQTEPYYSVGNTWMYLPVADTNYNGLSLSVTEKGWHGLFLKSGYTFSKSLGYDTGTDGTLTDRYNLRYDYGPIAYDMTNRWVTWGNYRIPGPHSTRGAANALLGGWEASGIFTLESGLPYTVTSSAVLNVGFSGGTGNRANLVGNPNLASGLRSRHDWFNTAAFANPAPYTWGNLGHNTLTAPHFNNVDFALQKHFILPWEGQRIIIRMEATNLFNRVDLGTPNANVSTPASFGVISSLFYGARQLQAVARYEF